MSRWRTMPDGRLTVSVGDHGSKIQLFQKRSGGVFYRTVWNPASGQKEWKSLRTRSKDEALKLGRLLNARLVTGAEEIRRGKVTLGRLWRRFSAECQAFLDNKPTTKRDTCFRAQILIAYFGEACEVDRLGPDDIQGYSKSRRAGTIKVGERALGPCRDRSVEADLVVLGQMARWATGVRQADGSRWLTSNPLAGVVRPRERNPRRPIATAERFEATIKALQTLESRAKLGPERGRWVRMQLALTLAEGTGRRLGSIRQLEWADFDRVKATIRWKAAYDKKGREATIPYPPTLFEAVWRLQRSLGAVQGWCFPAEKDPSRPMDRHLFDKWLRVAEEAAELPKLKGGLWHPYRRGWATARKHHPVVDVAAAGGWTDVETLLRCYQQPEAETLLRVTSEERRVGQAGLGSR